MSVKLFKVLLCITKNKQCAGVLLWIYKKWSPSLQFTHSNNFFKADDADDYGHSYDDNMPPALPL